MIYNVPVSLRFGSPMRVALLAASLIVVAALAGCSSKGSDSEDFHVTCADGTELHSEDFANVTTNADLLKKCPGVSSSSGSKSSTTSTPSAPNVAPTVGLTVTDDGGNATLVTLVDGNLTFDASSSVDSDGNITGAAVSVADSNQTRTASLFDPVTKTFKKATFNFDRPGIVNVTVAIVDDRAGFSTNVSQVYVNEVQVRSGSDIQLATSELADTLPTHDVCLGAGAVAPDGSGPVIDSQYFKVETISLQAGATFVTVTSTKDVVMTICSPDGAPVSPKLQEGTVTSDQPLPLPAEATKNYFVAFYGKLPVGGVPDMSSECTITVHYEPVAAAPAA